MSEPRTLSAEMNAKLEAAARCLQINQAAYGAAREEAKLRKEDMDEAQGVVNDLLRELYPPKDAAPLYDKGMEDEDHE